MANKFDEINAKILALIQNDTALAVADIATKESGAIHLALLAAQQAS